MKFVMQLYTIGLFHYGKFGHNWSIGVGRVAPKVLRFVENCIFLWFFTLLKQNHLLIQLKFIIWAYAMDMFQQAKFVS